MLFSAFKGDRALGLWLKKARLQDSRPPSLWQTFSGLRTLQQNTIRAPGSKTIKLHGEKVGHLGSPLSVMEIIYFATTQINI